MANKSDDEWYPATWPFRAAGTLLIAAMVWFCLGMMLHDVGESLPNYMPIFYAILLAGVVFVIGGAAYNITRERSRVSRG